MDIYDKLIDLRITLASYCDGFSIKDASKNLLLSSKLKILFLLHKKDMTQGELITTLSIAKSNLANLLKATLQEGLIESYRNSDNARNIFYKITSLGEDRLQEYKDALKVVFASVCTCDYNQLERSLDDILFNLKGENND